MYEFSKKNDEKLVIYAVEFNLTYEIFPRKFGHLYKRDLTVTFKN